MDKKTIRAIGVLGLIVTVSLFIGLLMGMLLYSYGEAILMKDYDLYNCIYNNADNNNFNDNPIMIKKIQDECICFREHNYTNVLDKC